MEDIIVTGATGFIGRNLIKELVKIFPKKNILCLIKDQIDDLEVSGRKILEQINVKTKEIDLTSGRGLENLPKNPKLIIHLGASFGGTQKYNYYSILKNKFPNNYYYDKWSKNLENVEELNTLKNKLVNSKKFMFQCDNEKVLNDFLEIIKGLTNKILLLKKFTQTLVVKLFMR